jgi:hypothetical protein
MELEAQIDGFFAASDGPGAGVISAVNSAVNGDFSTDPVA